MVRIGGQSKQYGAFEPQEMINPLQTPHLFHNDQLMANSGPVETECLRWNASPLPLDKQIKVTLPVAESELA